MAWSSSWGASWGSSWAASSGGGGATGCSWGGSWGDSWGVSWCGGDTPPGDGCFYGGDFFNGNFYCGGVTPTPTTTAPGPAGRSRPGKKRKVVIGDKVYEVDNLRDVDLLLKRVVRQESEPVTQAAKARVRVVDRVRADPEEQAAIRVPMGSVDVDWSALWVQLAMQDRAYAEVLERVLAKQEEDDIETILLMLH